MSDVDLRKLDTCGCCGGEPEEPEHTKGPLVPLRGNPPGLSEVSYRIGTHPTLLARMKARIFSWQVPDGDGAGRRPLAELTTRAADDPAIALMDAWATAGDVLTFYQERIANEAFLRTATERRSVLELARAIGYELAPGVAAEAYVAFTVDDAEGSPSEAPVPAGTQILSIPASQGELPQTFETSGELVARQAWNAMRPRLAEKQRLAAGPAEVYLAGTGTGLEVGDLVLSRVGSSQASRVVEVEVDTEAERTWIKLEPRLPASGYLDIPPYLPSTEQRLPLTRDTVFGEIFAQSWKESDLQAFLTQHQWHAGDVLAYVADFLEERLESSDSVFAMREEVGFFGHNAPYYQSLPEGPRSGPGGSPAGAFPHDWDDPDWEIWKDSLTGGYYAGAADVYLERQVSGLVADDSWAVFKGPGTAEQVFQVVGVTGGSRAGFGLSAKVTGLELADDDDGSLLDDNTTDKSVDFKVRGTVAYVASERLELAALPITGDLAAGLKAIVLGNMVLGLEEGQAVVLEGEEVDAGGARRREILLLTEIIHSLGLTRLEFTRAGSSDGLAYTYRRDTVTLNANVLLASHGETVNGEVLGSGDGSAAHQRFLLKKKPLTHVGSEAPSGAESTLQLRVDGVLWDEKRSLYGAGAGDRSYVLRLDDDAVPSVTFGDGKRGARLPTGPENVTATYRSGIGEGGEVGAGSLTLLKTRPFGIRGVTNPLAAAGAEDPEKLAGARDNAPLTVLTLDRIVSLTDYRDFARAYAGIGKAQAVTVWDGESERVHVTVADAGGDEVVEPLYGRLLRAIEAARDPLREVVLASFQPLVFHLKARVLIDGATLFSKVEPEVRAALLAAFSFERRDFGQPATAAEVLEVIHDVAGVEAVDLEELYQTATEETPPGTLFGAVLDAHTARWDREAGKIQPAELLLIHPLGIELTEWTS